MTRFARAKGSKSSNERLPEDATSWTEMKQQLHQKKQAAEDEKNRNEINAVRAANYQKFLKENTDKPAEVWADFPLQQIAGKHKTKPGNLNDSSKKKVKTNDIMKSFDELKTDGQLNDSACGVVASGKKKLKAVELFEKSIKEKSFQDTPNKGPKTQQYEKQNGFKQIGGGNIKKNGVKLENVYDESPNKCKYPQKGNLNENGNNNRNIITNGDDFDEPTPNKRKFNQNISENPSKKMKKQKGDIPKNEDTEMYTEEVFDNKKAKVEQKVDTPKKDYTEMFTEEVFDDGGAGVDLDAIVQGVGAKVSKKKKLEKGTKPSFVEKVRKHVEEMDEYELKVHNKKMARKQRQKDKRNKRREEDEKNGIVFTGPNKNKKGSKTPVVEKVKKPVEEMDEKELKIYNKKMARKQRQVEKRNKFREEKKALAEAEQNGEAPPPTQHKPPPPTKPKKLKTPDGEHKRRKPAPQQTETTNINGTQVELAYYDGFPIKKEDADRLQTLRKQMISKGLPRSEVKAALKLERRRAEKSLSREKKNVCFNCRQSGHMLSECPTLNDSNSLTTTACGICFKCGSTEHTHFECKVVRSQEFRFASCFICKEQGHISRQCPDNARGLYPKGGACKLCGDVTHLKKDCPQHVAEQEANTISLDRIGDVIEGLDGETKAGKPQQERRINKVVKF